MNIIMQTNSPSDVVQLISLTTKLLSGFHSIDILHKACLVRIMGVQPTDLCTSFSNNFFPWNMNTITSEQFQKKI